MTTPDNIPDRVTQLEAEMSEVRVLARGADEDVSNLQQTQLDLRQSVVEQSEEIREGFRKVTALLTEKAREE